MLKNIKKRAASGKERLSWKWHSRTSRGAGNALFLVSVLLDLCIH